MSINDSVFETLPEGHVHGYVGGEVIHSSGKLALNNVFIKDTDTKYTTDKSLLIHTGKSKGIKLEKINVVCPNGKDILAIFPQSSFQFYDLMAFVRISCSSCSQNSYALSGGQLGPSVSNQIHINCSKCSFGGHCKNGHIRAADNYWGYLIKTPNQEIRFASCPFGYCCLGIQCTNYSSCAKGRNGTLCGQCTTGLTENLVTPECVPPEQCRHHWLWIIVMIIGIAYVLLFMYLTEMAQLFKALLISKNVEKAAVIVLSINKLRNTFSSMGKWFLKLLNINRHTEAMTDQICFEISNGNEIPLCVAHHVGDTANSCQTSVTENSNADLFPGLLKILMFFYQSSVMYKIYSIRKSSGFLHVVQDLTVRFFNMQADGLFSNSITWCPFDSLQPVSKLIFKASFTFYLLTIVFFAFLIFQVRQLFNNSCDENRNAFHMRLCCCLLRILLISYGTLTATFLNLLLCVDLGSLGIVLFIDGSIECYQWWQFIVIAIAFVWIAFYPIAIYAASRLLHRNMLTTGYFLLALALPFPTVLYWLYVRYISHKEPVEGNALNNNSKDILQVLDGPFREEHNKDSCRLPWETVFIGRRLVLICVKIFVIDVVIRQYLMQIITVLFSLHHIYVRPFSSEFLNTVETISLIMLNIISVLNILPAYVYMNPTFDSSNIQGYVKVFQDIETVLMLLFPAVIGFCVAVLLGIRILQFMYWVIKVFVRLVRKYRGSETTMQQMTAP